MIHTRTTRRMACALAIAAAATMATRARAQQAAVDSIPTVDVSQLAEPTEIINRDAVARAIASRFGRLGPGAAGIVMVAFVVDETGKPADVQVATSSGFPAVDRAALEVARVVRLSPATLNGRPVRVRLRMPISLGVDAPEAIQGDAAASVDTAAVYEVAQLTRQPELANRDQVAAAMRRNYPRALSNEGVVPPPLRVEALIGRDGRVETARVVGDAPPQFAEAALAVARVMRFRPGTVNGVPVRVRFEMPVTFSRH